MRLLLILIVILGIFFRTYQLIPFYEYSHEQDLQSFIVKDILEDKHLRLIGQETSITGVFVGPLYYYSLVPFYALFKGDPFAANGLILLVSVLSITSIYWVLKKLYSQQAGLIGAFIYATSLPIVIHDRWAVPTQPTLLYTIWFYYVLTSLSRGDLKVLPILIILLSLIWHVHIAFIPLLILVPISVVLSGKLGKFGRLGLTKKNLFYSIALFVIFVSPLLIFEFRHGFQQLQGLIAATQQGSSVLYGEYKFETLLVNISRVLKEPLFNSRFPELPRIWIIPGFLGVFIFLSSLSLKLLPKKELVLIYLWIINIIISHQLSLRPIAGYYFNNLYILSTIIYALIGAVIFRWNKLFGLGILLIFLTVNIQGLSNRPIKHGEYQDKKAVAQFIKKDADKNNYLCVALNFMGDVGSEYGYRYIFYKFGPKVITPGNDVPVYSIAIPHTRSEDEVDFVSGNIGVLLPDVKGIDPTMCSQPTRQLPPLNGFVN